LLANPGVVEEALKMRNGTLTLEKVLKEAGLTEKWKAEGKAEGEARGEEKKALEIARNLIQKGWELNEIAETTNLSVDKIKPLYRPQRKKALKNR
jgi:predicted transposase YdaD